MAKKYLLYIHDERFEKEPKKSELINALLFDWYGRIKAPGNPLESPIIIKTKEDVIPVMKAKNKLPTTEIVPEDPKPEPTQYKYTNNWGA